MAKYVNKYNYLDFYTKQENLWFYSNTQIEATISSQKDLIKHTNLLFEDDEEEIEEIDCFEALRKNEYLEEENLEYSCNNKELLNIFRNKINNLKNVDDLNPLIIQGQILDKKSKDAIVKQYNKNNDFVVYDFDKYKFNLENGFIETIKLIKENKKIIIFQPTFIDKKRNIVTKCDALVKDDLEIHIIETKGTTSATRIHFLDIFYQYKLIDSIDELKDYYFEYFLCLVKYEKLKRNGVSFIITDSLNLTKAAPAKTRDLLEEEFQSKKIGHHKNGYSIAELLSQEFKDSEEPKIDKFKSSYYDVLDKFEEVIHYLNKTKQSFDKNKILEDITPSKNDKNEFKNTYFWNALKDLYVAKGYAPFKYSGNFTDHIKLTNECYNFKNQNIFDFKDYFKKPEKFEAFSQKFKFNYKNINYDILNESNIINLIKTLKTKKVYFDFETINSSIRPIDNIYPFVQIVTQCSIIKSIDDKIQSPINMMIDPKDINKQWWKEIIDNLYESEDASYIVYNKSFENTRLKEISSYINEKEYEIKINIIINNIFDLADFFNFNKKTFLLENLYGYYSIKKVLPLIEENAKEIFDMTNCVSYKTLNINNGLICQNFSLLRFLEKIDDKKWIDIMKDSKDYCENDVKAMIAVEYFIIDCLIKESMPDFYENYKNKK